MTRRKNTSPLPVFLGVGAAMLAAVLTVVLVVTLVGRRGGRGEAWVASPEQAPASASAPADPAEARLNSLPVETLRGAMPQQSDFPADWDVKISAAPAQIEGFGQLIKQFQVSPPECGTFIEDELGSGSGLEAGEWITVVSASEPRKAREDGNETTVAFTALRKPNTRPNLADMDRRLATCPHLSFTMPDMPEPIVIDLVRADTSGITGAKAVGSIATAKLDGRTMTVTAIYAVAHGIVISAQANADTEQKDFLVQLVQKTIDRLDRLS